MIHARHALYAQVLHRLPNVYEITLDRYFAQEPKGVHRDLELFYAVYTNTVSRLTCLRMKMDDREDVWISILPALLKRAKCLKTLVIEGFVARGDDAVDFMLAIASCASLRQLKLDLCDLVVSRYSIIKHTPTSKIEVVDIIDEWPLFGPSPSIYLLPLFTHLRKLSLDFTNGDDEPGRHMSEAVDGCHQLTDLSIRSIDAFRIFECFTHLSLRRVKLTMPHFLGIVFESDQGLPGYIESHSKTLDALFLDGHVLMPDVCDQIHSLCTQYGIDLTWIAYEEEEEEDWTEGWRL